MNALRILECLLLPTLFYVLTFLFHIHSFYICFSATNELVFLNFYADWCRFSQILGPIFDEASETIEKENNVSIFYKIHTIPL